jgi:hypothetical protein
MTDYNTFINILERRTNCIIESCKMDDIDKEILIKTGIKMDVPFIKTTDNKYKKIVTENNMKDLYDFCDNQLIKIHEYIDKDRRIMFFDCFPTEFELRQMESKYHLETQTGNRSFYYVHKSYYTHKKRCGLSINNVVKEFSDTIDTFI